MKKREFSKNQYVLFGITAAVLLFAVIFMPSFLFQLSKNHVILPWYIKFENADINDKDQGVEIVLKNKEVIFKADGNAIWTSEENSRVSNVMWEDIDGDSEKELVILCWKKGRYGKHKPFWVEKDETLWSQHIYIYEYLGSKNQVRPKWMASDIGFEVDGIEYEEGKIVLTNYADGGKTSWRWSGWGLERLK